MINVKKFTRHTYHDSLVRINVPPAKIRRAVENEFGAEYQPRVGEIVAAWTGAPSTRIYDRFEGGESGAYVVGGSVYENMRTLDRYER